MNSDRINVVWVVSPNLKQKMVYVRSDFELGVVCDDNHIVTVCDEIKWAKSYDRSPTFGIIAIVDGKRREYVFHNIICAEVVYA